jgi:hypothetical protein
MPDRPRIVVSDTTPLIALAVIDQVKILGPLLSELRRGGIRLGDALVREALNLAGE